MSAQTVEAPEFGTGTVLSILQRHGFPADHLVIELTEHRPLRDPDAARVKFDAFRRHGIRFAADDLGAGNAGLRLLAQVRFDVLKVDLSLVQRSGPGAPSNAVIGSVVGLATQTDALVIAEGLEHPEQVAQVATLGVRAGQGYLLGRPAPLPAFPARGRSGELPRPRHADEELVGVAALAAVDRAVGRLNHSPAAMASAAATSAGSSAAPSPASSHRTRGSRRHHAIWRRA